ncbi:MAG: DNA polymerase Y family protein [Chitinophagaceae bacterium]|nr:MAG: DNA polymerase Y family protein [Chitinophagaceae bacterium]
MIIQSCNVLANAAGIFPSMTVADARALLPAIVIQDDIPGLPNKLLLSFARWFIRYTPVVAIDGEDGLLLDATGCAHLWGGEQAYLQDMHKRIQGFGYHSRLSMAATIGAAWAVSRYGANLQVIPDNKTAAALLALPAAALRPEPATLERLQKLGLRQIKQFIQLPRSSLRRRFGAPLLLRIDQALGTAAEIINPVMPLSEYREWLPCMDPIVSATGIEIAIQTLLEKLCALLKKEEKGLRSAKLSCHRVDGKIIPVTVNTSMPSSNPVHLFKLLELHISSIEPDLGIELFVLEAMGVEASTARQDHLWSANGGLTHLPLAELLDRIAGRFGEQVIQRFLPDAHYWPERSYKQAASLQEKPFTEWKASRRRPLRLLRKPALIEVTAPIPDYPPMFFKYAGRLYKIARADGPERIEQEWWLQEGQHRDYYIVETAEGQRFWLFRLGHYDAAKTYGWYLHGFFA